MCISYWTLAICQFSCEFFCWVQGCTSSIFLFGGPLGDGPHGFGIPPLKLKQSLGIHRARGDAIFVQRKGPTGKGLHQQPTERVMCIWWFLLGGWEGWCKNFVWIPRMQSWVVVNTLKWLKFKPMGHYFSRNTVCSIGILVMAYLWNYPLYTQLKHWKPHVGWEHDLCPFLLGSCRASNHNSNGPTVVDSIWKTNPTSPGCSVKTSSQSWPFLPMKTSDTKKRLRLGALKWLLT